MYRTIKHEIRHGWLELHEKYSTAYTEIIGWSLGSSQAILCAQDLNYNFGLKPYLYTFGSVRPFKGTKKNKKLLAKYLSSLCTECYNFANRNDIVTYMPPFRNFCMISRVDLGDAKISIKKLLNPFVYHTSYDDINFYNQLK